MLHRYCCYIAIPAVLLAGMACSSHDDVYGNVRPVTPDPVTPPVVTDTVVSLPSDWKKAAALMEGLPSGIAVYQNTTAYNGKALNAYCVAFDPKNAQLELKPVLPEKNTKPAAIYAAEPGKPYVCINGGFFGTNASYSLVQYNGVVSAVNIKSLGRQYNGTAATYYPTRGAFGITAAGAPDITWIYHVGTGNGTIYSYPAPSPNVLNSAPQQQPTAGFPAGGVQWNVASAIGGSPVLIKNGNINVTDTAELIDIDNSISRARSAIGYTGTGKIVLVAVQGGDVGTGGGGGLSLRELADLMKRMGCTAALNLDGGGSTSMVVNGKLTVKPSDTAGERAVMSAIILKKK
ncbi:phosphodiester glycosidase family protein [Filimonas effusa]|nr:phosphodiester glycosidase family protein [Filimonas effusa]